MKSSDQVLARKRREDKKSISVGNATVRFCELKMGWEACAGGIIKMKRDARIYCEKLNREINRGLNAQ